MGALEGDRMRIARRLMMGLVLGLFAVSACSAEAKIDTKDGVRIEGDVDQTE